MDELFKWLLGAFGSLLGVNAMFTMRRLSEAEKQAREAKTMILEHKLHTSENYETKSTIARLHDKIESIQDDIKELPQTILNLIDRKK